MDKILNLPRQVLKHELIGGSFLIFVGTTIASVFSFLINLFLARNLSYPDYGTFSSLISLYTLATIPAASLTVVVVRFATGYLARSETDKAGKFYRKMILVWTAIGILISVGFFIFSSQIAGFLKINSEILISLIGISVALSYIGVVNVGYLQSLTKFSYMSFVYVTGAAVRLISGVGLVFFGLKVLGGVLAIPIMAIATLLITFIPLRKFFFTGSGTKINFSLSEIGRYALPASVSILFLSSFISMDVVLVKHFLSPTDAGLYGGLSLVGKVIFYFTGPIPIVMFPLLVKRHVNNEKIHSTFLLSIFLVAIPSILITIFYFLFPEFCIKFFLAGREYLKVAPYLGLFGIFLTIYSLLNVFVNFFLSLKKTKVFIPLGFGALMQIILISFMHNSFIEIIKVSIFSSGLILVLLLLYYIHSYETFDDQKRTTT